MSHLNNGVLIMLLLVLRYFLSVVVYLFLLVFTVIPMSLLVPLYYRPQPYDQLDRYTWGGLYGTFDNPPQGDKAWLTKRCPFPNVTTGFKGYINRVGWMFRNPLYGYARQASIKWEDGDYRVQIGNPNISDKYKIAGWLITKCYSKDAKIKAAGFYCVLPWSKTRNLRIRLGWKVKSDKVEEIGLMQFVFTINPFDGYGNN